jgi:hypothetical protein
MRIEIFVTHSEKEDLKMLDSAKKALIDLCGGLTEINHNRGYWKESDTIWVEKTDIYLIYVNSTLKRMKPLLIPILKQIKTATKQTSQMVAVNNESFLI